MTDRNKFEQMLELLINEDKEKAEELFHEIVVEKSRNIYESLLESETEEDEDEAVDEATDEEVDESDEEELDEFEEFEVEADDDMDMGGDPADDMIGDIDMDGDDEGDDMEGEDDEDLEDRVVDLEDALDDLKAEFEKMMDGDEGEGEEDEMDMDMDDEGEEEPEEESIEFESEEEEDDAEAVREYVEKVAEPKGEDNKAKSPVAGKNDMGGTAANIAKGSSEEKGGKANSPKEDNAGNVNVPGGKASKSYKKATVKKSAE
jgi:hypothetical protein